MPIDPTLEKKRDALADALSDLITTGISHDRYPEVISERERYGEALDDAVSAVSALVRELVKQHLTQALENMPG